MINQTILELISGFLDQIFPLAVIGAIIALLLGIWILGGFFKFLIKRTTFLHPDARNGFLLLINVVQVFLVLLMVLTAFSIMRAPENFLLGVIAILLAALGISSTTVAYNIIGGIYILVTRPFSVGDYIKTQRVEGIVEEIGLNYTKIVLLDRTSVTIPNNNLVNNSLLNYNVKIDNLSEVKELDLKEIAGLVYQESFPEKIVRYKLQIELNLDAIQPKIPLKTVINRLENVCEEFTPVYGFKPQYYLGRSHFRQDVIFIITCSDAYTIYNSWPLFMEAIFTITYLELQRPKEEGSS
jgi:hypothetical protein